MGFVFPQADGSMKLDLTDEWYEDFNEVYETLDPEDRVNEEDMQIDNRNIVVENQICFFTQMCVIFATNV